MECPIEGRNDPGLLLEYCARKLNPETSAKLALHISECPACSAWVHRQELVWQALDNWETPPVSDNFNRRLFSRIEAAERAPWWRRAFQSRLILRPVLAVALASGLVVAVFVTRPHVPGPRPSQAVETVDADRLERALDDVEMLQQLDGAPLPEAPRL